jgi:hypothetical protein
MGSSGTATGTRGHTSLGPRTMQDWASATNLAPQPLAVCFVSVSEIAGGN